jgi:hypothetical protein
MEIPDTAHTLYLWKYLILPTPVFMDIPDTAHTCIYGNT